MKPIRIEDRNIEIVSQLEPGAFPSGINSEQSRINFLLEKGINALEAQQESNCSGDTNIHEMKAS
jgi:hypothetical protein